MAEDQKKEQTTEEQNNEQANQPIFSLQRCYLKDASLEMPHAPQSLVEAPSEQPQVDIQFEVAHKPLNERFFDIVLRATVTVKDGEKVLVLAEAKQGAIFEMFGLPPEHIQHILNVVCPTMVYPYLRSNIADLMSRATVAPVHLPEVNFDGLYQQRLAEAAKNSAQETERKDN